MTNKILRFTAKKDILLDNQAWHPMTEREKRISAFGAVTTLMRNPDIWCFQEIPLEDQNKPQVHWTEYDPQEVKTYPRQVEDDVTGDFTEYLVTTNKGHVFFAWFQLDEEGPAWKTGEFEIGPNSHAGLVIAWCAKPAPYNPETKPVQI